MFKIGDGASYNIGSDSYPMTIRKVSSSGKTVWATSDRFKGKPGANSYANYEKIGAFIPQENADLKRFSLRKDGKFRPVGSTVGSLTYGRSYRQDPHF